MPRAGNKWPASCFMIFVGRQEEVWPRSRPSPDGAGRIESASGEPPDEHLLQAGGAQVALGSGRGGKFASLARQFPVRQQATCCRPEEVRPIWQRRPALLSPRATCLHWPPFWRHSLPFVPLLRSGALPLAQSAAISILIGESGAAGALISPPAGRGCNSTLRSSKWFERESERIQLPVAGRPVGIWPALGRGSGAFVMAVNFIQRPTRVGLVVEVLVELFTGSARTSRPSRPQLALGAARRPWTDLDTDFAPR